MELNEFELDELELDELEPEDGCPVDFFGEIAHCVGDCAICPYGKRG